SRLQGVGFVGDIYLSDLVDNVCWDDFDHSEVVTFQSVDFLDLSGPPLAGLRCSIWSNPPYSYKKVWYDGRKVSISEAFV
ncbi:hypothetical protein, partial [Klebsiella pneumoniae]|uniref:hypothetical protein n=1 Tax=Klebsiella pneumoniae TaxID=573 RepID=UPI003EE06FE6